MFYRKCCCTTSEDILTKCSPNTENAKYYLLSENVSQMKFRYYQVKKNQPKEFKEINNPTHSGSWVNRVVTNPFQVTQETPSNLLSEFEKANKISLPRAVEITIGITPQGIKNKGNGTEASETFFSPPIVVLLNSGMEIAIPEKKEENNEKA